MNIKAAPVVLYLGSKTSDLYMVLEFSTAKTQTHNQDTSVAICTTAGTKYTVLFSLNQIINIMSYTDIQVSILQIIEARKL
jgi:hypothetical protein